MSRRVLSELSEVSPRYLAQLEAGEGNISVVLLDRVARALDVPIEALIAENIPANPKAQRISRLYAQSDDAIRTRIDSLLIPAAKKVRKAGRICLTGLRGAGKTTLGKGLADRLGVPFVELSQLIAAETGIPAGEVLSLYGRDGYRRLEADMLDHVSQQAGPMVFAVSGGIVEQEASYARLLDQFHTIWLHASLVDHMERAQAQVPQTADRIEPDALAQFRTLIAARLPLYARAEARVDTSKKTPEVALEQLMATIAQRGFAKL